MPCQLARRSTWSAAVADFWNPTGARHDGWFVQDRRCHYQLGLDIDPRPVRHMASSDFRRPRARRLIQGVTAVNPAHSLPSDADNAPCWLVLGALPSWI
jgi:hypothetical protein